ncbi:MAG: MBL fold metallo-hydrolase, partial [Nocardioides sp.]
LYVVQRHHPDGPRPPVPVWGPAGTAERMARAYDLPADPGMREEFDFATHDAQVELGPFLVEPVAVEHPVPAFGFRVSADGRTLGYSGDTGPCAGLDAIAGGADLLLAEASFSGRRTNPAGLHLTGADCGAAATRGASRRLLLTHVPAWGDPQAALEEARSAYDGPVELARSGGVHEV